MLARLARSRTRAVAIAIALAAPFLLSASPAAAEQLVQHVYGGQSFNGADATGGEFGNHITDIAVNDATGDVYVVTSGCSGCGINQFTAAGVAEPYTSPQLGGSTTLVFPGNGSSLEGRAEIAIDNTGGPTQGRMYLSNAHQEVYAYNPDGTLVSGFPIDTPNVGGLAVDPRTGHLWVLEGSFHDDEVKEFTQSGEYTENFFDVNATAGTFSLGHNLAIDSNGNFYLTQNQESGGDHLVKYSADGKFQYVLDPSIGGGFEGNDVAVDPSTNDVYYTPISYPPANQRVYQYNEEGTQVAAFGQPPGVEGEVAVGVNPSTGTVYVGRKEPGKRVDIFPAGPTVTVPTVLKGGFSEVEGTSATIHGTVDPDGVPTTSCRFEWGPTTAYGHTESCEEGEVLTGSGAQNVTLHISGLTKGETYHYRLIAGNENGEEVGGDTFFVSSSVPVVTEEFVNEVHSDQVLVHATINPEGVPTTFHVEYGPEDCAVNSCSSTVEQPGGTGTEPVEVSFRVTGLSSGTEYRYRVVATNQSGPGVGADHWLKTFPLIENLVDPCPNAHVRQQTGSALLLDCRAYELVSAGNAGGYNVESDLVGGQRPYDGYPKAGQVLYAVHSGAIPGSGAPTNRGRDPYLATRGPQGWTTEYVGVPSDNPYSAESFGSELIDADPSLGTLAFGGPGICSPCFADGSTNIPMRLPGGQLVEGMGAAADPAGHVGRYLSADGHHLVFGTTTKLAPAGNDNGDVTIYERDVAGGDTQVVSTTAAGDTMTGSGIGELDVSSDGSRVVVGRKVSEDSAGNEYWQLYMHVGTSPDASELTPGASDGVLYDGMTADGSKVFFTTADSLLAEDEDEDADIYEAEVDPLGNVSLSLVSSGGGGEVCDPPERWNSTASQPNCGALALAGGAGVASGDGTFYFLSPELLDGPNNGTQDQPNLYVVRPGGAPHFVGTIDSSIGRVPPPPAVHPLLTDEFGELSPTLGLAVDGTSNDVYIIDSADESIHRFTKKGAPDAFSAPAAGGTNALPVSIHAFSAGMAVDNSTASPLHQDLYLARGESTVGVYEPTGELAGELTGLSEPCGVGVDLETGTVYVADRGLARIWRFEPKPSAAAPIDNTDYEVTALNTSGIEACQLGIDGAGDVYAAEAFGQVRKFSPEEFGPSPYPSGAGTSFAEEPAAALAVDPVTNEVYVANFSEINVYGPDNTHLSTFSNVRFSRAAAVDPATHHLYVTSFNGGFKVSSFAWEGVLDFHLLESAAVRHAKFQSAVHHYGDFQVTADGHYAAFAGTQPLTGFDSHGHAEVFRYDASSDHLDCPSCNPTGARAAGDATLPQYGLGLLDDGRVFFDSSDAIAPRDLDGNGDAFEWENGTLELISTGVSNFDSSLLGVSASGKDAFFFTRDTLVPQDENGPLVKIYDAREEGGFPYLPPAVPCKASDECHGPSSPTPAPPNIGTIRGTSGNFIPSSSAKPKCKPKHRGGRRKHRARRRRARRGSACVHRHRHHGHRRAHHRNGTRQKRGGGGR
jgi:hypothetical protein